MCGASSGGANDRCTATRSRQLQLSVLPSAANTGPTDPSGALCDQRNLVCQRRG